MAAETGTSRLRSWKYEEGALRWAPSLHRPYLVQVGGGLDLPALMKGGVVRRVRNREVGVVFEEGEDVLRVLAWLLERDPIPTAAG